MCKMSRYSYKIYLKLKLLQKQQTRSSKYVDAFNINNNNVSPKLEESPFGYSLVIHTESMISLSVKISGGTRAPVNTVRLHLEHLKGNNFNKTYFPMHKKVQKSGHV